MIVEIKTVLVRNRNSYDYKLYKDTVQYTEYTEFTRIVEIVEQVEIFQTCCSPGPASHSDKLNRGGIYKCLLLKIV